MTPRQDQTLVQDEPAWLKFMKEDTYQDENYVEEKSLLDIIRRMLEAEGDERAIIDNAVNEYVQHETQRLEKRFPGRGFDHNSVAYKIDYIAEPVISIAAHTSLTSLEHNRCAEFLTSVGNVDYIRFKAPDKEAYVEAFKMGLAIRTERFWNTSCVPTSKPVWVDSQSWFDQECAEGLSTEALFAKLYQSKASDYGRKYAFAGLRRAFGTSFDDPADRISPDAEPQAAAYAREAAAQYILLAGERIADAVCSVEDNPALVDQQRVAKWKHFQEQFKQLAEQGNPSDEWNLGLVEHAKQAYEKMVELSAARGF